MINYEKKVIFCHIPKNAGTSMCLALERAGGYQTIAYPSVARDAELTWKHGECRRVWRHIDRALWDSCFKFAFVRNPWDRLVSAWEYTRQKGYHGLTFEQFLTRTPQLDPATSGRERAGVINTEWHAMVQVRHLIWEGRVAVDFVGRVENVDEDWKELSARIGCQVPLPHANGSVRRDYREYFDAATGAAARSLVQSDASTFGYRF